MDATRKVTVDVVIDIALLDALDDLAKGENASRSGTIRRLLRKAMTEVV